MIILTHDQRPPPVLLSNRIVKEDMTKVGLTEDITVVQRAYGEDNSSGDARR